MEKYDASNDCISGLNRLTKPSTRIVVEGNCGGVRGGTGEKVVRKAKKRRHRRG
jgi:hypothetical protein